MIFTGLSHVAGSAAGQAARKVAKELGLGPAGQAFSVATAHMVVGLALTPLDATGVVSPGSALAHGAATFHMTLANEARTNRRAARRALAT